MSITNNGFVHETSADKFGPSLTVQRDQNGSSLITLISAEKGHQPTIYDDLENHLILICIGHMYARKSATFSIQESLRILSNVYKTSGMDAMQDAIGGGIYSMIIVDKERNMIFATTDMLSCMPLFFRKLPDTFQMGMNQFDLASGSEADSLACLEYLDYGYLPFHKSLFTEIGRLGPGQIVTLDLLRPGEFQISKEIFPSYLPLDQRISDEGEACNVLDVLFTKFFSRIGNEQVASGLSGGYDSRLIAAYCRNRRIQLRTFDNPQTNEARVAQYVAAAIGCNTEVFQIPADTPSRLMDDFVHATGTMDSLESSHVYGNLDAQLSSQPDYVLDGFLGGETLGCQYYYKLLGGIEPLWKVLLAQDHYRQQPLPNSSYIDRLSGASGKRIKALSSSDEKALDGFVADKLAQMADSQRDACSTDADMLELLTYRIRTSRLIAGGPVTFLRRVPTLCPFYDVDIFKTCMSIDKSIRAGDRLYNAFYRNRFPELAVIPKESTGAKATYSPVLYRMNHFKNALIRRLSKRLPKRLQRNAKAGGDLSSFQDKFLGNKTNQAYFEETLRNSTLQSQKLKIQPLMDKAKTNPTLYLRLISLACMFGQIRK